jgi:hypothetical protein
MFCLRALIVVLALSGGLRLRAQDAVSLTGIVTDTSGALIPGASVELINTLTNTKYKTVTSSGGTYTIPNIQPGPGYKVTFSHEGFESAVFSDLYLNVGTTRTQNAQLVVGSVSQSVQVSETNNQVTLNTTDATIGNNFDVQTLNDLPVYDRSSPSVLFQLQPGTTSDGAVTGARTDQSSVTVDGLDVNDIAAGTTFAVVSNAPVDSVQEFRGTVAGLLANAGPGGGGQFQLVTKSGTNHFHGDLNEYHRNTITTANDWFNNDAGVARPALIRNQFGGNLGGPILRDKLFFFFDYDGSRIAQSASTERAVPLDSYRNGTIQYINTAGTLSPLSPTGIAAIDPLHLGTDAPLQAFVLSRYPRVNDPTQGDGVNSGGYRFNNPEPDKLNIYVGKVDYNLTATQRVFARLTVTRENAIQQTNEFPTDPVSFPFFDKSYSYVGGWTWAIGANKVNQLSYGDVISVYDFAALYDPTGADVFGFSSPFSAPYKSPSSQRRRVPVPVVRDDFNWQKGRHSLFAGGTFKFIKTNSSLVNNFNFPGIGLGNANLALNAALRPSDLDENNSAAVSTYDSAFAFALGEYNGVSSNFNYNNKGQAQPQGSGAIRRYRYYETEFYAGDTWKATKNLTFSYGLKYMLYTVPYEAQGDESIQNFTFDQYFDARRKQSAAGIYGGAPSVVPYIVYKLGGKANHAPALYSPSYTDFAPRFSFAWNPPGHEKTVFNGGAGIVFDRTVINAINFIQDQSSYLFQNSANNIFGVADPVASLSTEPRFASFTSVPNVPKPTPVTVPFTPFVDPVNGPYGLPNNEFQTTIDPKLKDPYSIALNAGFQHEFPSNLVLKLNYSGRLGRRLIAQADASQLIDFRDPTSGQFMSTAFANITKALRKGEAPATQPWFDNLASGFGYTGTQIVTEFLGTLAERGDFADTIQALAGFGVLPQNVGMASQLAENTFITNKGSSNYHGMLVTLSKNPSHGLRFDVNYTWSHSIDNTSLVANSIASSSGVGFICDVVRPRECRGNSDFDVRHLINANFDYDLPFGKGRTYAATAPRWLDEAIGGWNLDGIPTWRSGTPFNAVSNAFVAGYANNAPAIYTSAGSLNGGVHRDSTGTVRFWSNTSAIHANYTGPVGFAIGTRNNIHGPALLTFDAGLGKTFPVVENFRFKFRADAFNVLNHPGFGNPISDITSNQFGQITGDTIGARVMQFSLRAEF